MESIKYKYLNFWHAFFGGHISFLNITIFGSNAMNWTVNIRTKKYGAICFTLPTLSRFTKDRYTKKYRFDWYFYLSPNGTPWASTYYIGSSKKENIRAKIRFLHFGHNFDSWSKLNNELHELNNKMDGII